MTLVFYLAIIALCISVGVGKNRALIFSATRPRRFGASAEHRVQMHFSRAAEKLGNCALQRPLEERHEVVVPLFKLYFTEQSSVIRGIKSGTYFLCDKTATWSVFGVSAEHRVQMHFGRVVEKFGKCALKRPLEGTHEVVIPLF